MNLRARMVAIWRDPVGSKLIAALIIAAAGSVYAFLATRPPPSSILAHPVARLGIPTLVVLSLLLVWHRLRGWSKTLVFLSRGGTGRDPMAKAILTELLSHITPRPRINVLAAGLGPVDAQEAEFAARYVIREMFGRDLLKDHKPQLLTADLVARADLILVMDDSLLDSPQKKGVALPPAKTYLLKAFFGSVGNIDDPYPDGKDEATLNRYRACANELHDILRNGLARLTRVFNL